MVLGSALEGKAAILKYESEDMESWEYTGPLLTEEEDGIRCVECPDFMELDGKYLVIGALMHHQDPFGRYQMSRYHVGDFKEGIFTEESRGWFDFCGNCYAMQSFEHDGRRISIGWISDFYGEHQEKENGGGRMLLIYDEKGLRLRTYGVKSEHVTFPADVDRVEKLEIFVDRRTAEIYVNDGEAAGTKLFYDTSDAGCFILHTDTPECIKRAEVFCMRSIWA